MTRTLYNRSFVVIILSLLSNSTISHSFPRLVLFSYLSYRVRGLGRIYLFVDAVHTGLGDHDT